MSAAAFSTEIPHHVVIGGGFSGLYTAFALLQKGEHVVLYEAANFGGLIQTRHTPWGMNETAANGFLASPRLLEILEDLRLPYIQPKPSAKARFIHSLRGIRRWPLGPLETVTTLLKFAWAALTRQTAPRAQESVYDWGRRCLGEAAATQLVLPGMQGIYATSAKELSATLILSRFFGPSKRKFRKAKVRGTVSFHGGMADFIQALVKRLEHDPRCRIVKTRVSDSQIETFQNNPLVKRVWIATHASAAAKLVTKASPALSQLIAQVPLIPVLSVTAFFKPDEDLQGFGVLNHPDLKTDVLGVLFNNEIFEGRSHVRSETWILRAAGSEQLAKKSSAELQVHLEAARALHFGKQAKALHLAIQAWPQGLPHFGMKLEQIQGEFQKDWGKLRLVGNYVRGIGLSRIIDLVDERVQA